MANKTTYPFEVKDLKRIYKYMISNGFEREAHLIVIGCNMALRSSDLLVIRFDQVIGVNSIKEKKTDKHKELFFNDTCLNHIKELQKFYISKGIKNATYLFQTTSRNSQSKHKPITTNWLNKVLSECQHRLKIGYPIGTHSMRKTWGKFNFDNGVSLELIQKTLNHSSPAVTLKYIGIERENIRDNYMNNQISVF